MKKIHLFSYLTVKENEWNINLFTHIFFLILRDFVVGKLNNNNNNNNKHRGVCCLLLKAFLHLTSPLPNSFRAELVTSFSVLL